VAEKDPAIDQLTHQLDELNRALGQTEKDAKDAKGSILNVGEASEKAAKDTTALSTAFGNLASNQMQAAIDGASEWIRSIPEAAARSEAYAAALASLGGANDAVRAATNGVVTAEQARTIQQRTAQAGLHLTAQELAAVTQRAREYARVTGVELGQALDQLTDQLVNPGQELQRFGIVLQQGQSRGQMMAEALRQLQVQASQTAVSAQTLAESYEDFNRAQAELSDGLRDMIAQGLELGAFFQQATSWLRGLRSSTDAWDTALRAVLGTLGEITSSDTLRRMGQTGAGAQSASGGFVAQYGQLLGAARSAGIDTRAFPMQGEIAQARPEEQQRLIAAMTREINARRSAPHAAGMFGSMSDAEMAALPVFGADGSTGYATSAASIASDISGAVSARAAIAAQVADKARRNQAAQRTRDLSAASAGASSSGSATPQDTTAAILAAMRAPVSQEWANAFTQAAQRAEASQTAARGGTIATQAEGIDLQRRSREAQLGIGRGAQGDFDPTTRSGQDQTRRERITILREQREALAALVTEAEREEQLARASGASQTEINELMRSRIGIQQALAQSTRDLSEATASNTSALSEMGAKLSEVAEGMASGFAEAAIAALDGAQSFDQAIGQMLRSTLKSVAQMAIVEALKNTALGIGHLAAFNYGGAANAFAAAGAWVAVGAAAGIAIAATRPSASAASTPSASSSMSSARPDASARPDRGSGGPLNLSIVVSGAIFETRHEVLQGIARGVTDAAAHGYIAPGALAGALHD